MTPVQAAGSRGPPLRTPAVARWRSAPEQGPRLGGRGGRTGPLRRGRGSQAGRRGPRRRLRDFGFDLPGDELIPPYNRPRGDRENGCGAICVAMGTIARARPRTHAGGARAWKNTAFVGGACHSRRGDLGRRGSSLFPQVRSGEAVGPRKGVLAEAGWDPWVFPNSSEDPSPLHSSTQRLAHPFLTLASITPAHTFRSPLAGSTPGWRGVPAPQLVCTEPTRAGAGTTQPLPFPLDPSAAHPGTPRQTDTQQRNRLRADLYIPGEH